MGSAALLPLLFDLSLISLRKMLPVLLHSYVLRDPKKVGNPCSILIVFTLTGFRDVQRRLE